MTTDQIMRLALVIGAVLGLIVTDLCFVPQVIKEAEKKIDQEKDLSAAMKAGAKEFVRNTTLFERIRIGWIGYLFAAGFGAMLFRGIVAFVLGTRSQPQLVPAPMPPGSAGPQISPPPGDVPR